MKINPKTSITPEFGVYGISPLAQSLYHSGIQLDTDKTILHSGHWRKSEDEDFFINFNSDDLKLLQDRKAILFLDFTTETENQRPGGFFAHLNTLFNRYNIVPSDVIVFTGNGYLPEKYEEYKKTLPEHASNFHLFYYYVTPQFLTNQGDLVGCANPEVIPLDYPPLDKIFDWWHSPYEEQLAYKTANKHYIKTLSCFIGRRGVQWRDEVYKKLIEEDLWVNNLCSYAKEKQYLPEDMEIFIDRSLSDKEKARKMHINPKILSNAWMHVPVETSFDSDNFLATHEKVSKATSYCLPFVAVGSKGQLDLYRDIGYKTFDNHFDESYNKLSNDDRLNAIVKLLKQIDAIPDKLAWYESMRDVLEHNYDVALSLYSNDIKENLYFNNFLTKLNQCVRTIV